MLSASALIARLGRVAAITALGMGVLLPLAGPAAADPVAGPRTGWTGRCQAPPVPARTMLRDLFAQLFPQGPFGPATPPLDFVENEYELPTLLCQAGITAMPTPGPTETLPPLAPITVPVSITVFCTASRCPVTPNQVTAQISQLDADFAGTPISFTVADTEFVVAPQFVASPALLPYSPLEAQMKAQYHQGGYGELNLYITDFAPRSSGLTQNLLTWETMPVPHPSPAERTLDGIVINATQVGAGDKSLARAVGYWMSLYNPWHVGLDGAGDYVDDLPALPGPTFYCAVPPDYPQVLPWQQPSLLNNMMEYTPDTCRQKFSVDQAVRMWADYTALRADTAGETAVGRRAR